MEYEKIKQLMNDMGNSKLTSISIDLPDGTKISMQKEKEVLKVSEVRSKQENIVTEQIDEIKEVKKQGNIVNSPMVGTFYSKPAPDQNPFVEVGKTVKKGDILCIIEAMKLMNEIESEFDGKIKEILVKDGEAVEYGRPLFIIN